MKRRDFLASHGDVVMNSFNGDFASYVVCNDSTLASALDIPLHAGAFAIRDDFDAGLNDTYRLYHFMEASLNDHGFFCLLARLLTYLP